VTEADLPPLRVLVIDDCPDTTASMTQLLRLWGHEARVAGDGPGGLAAAAAFRPDVVLLDLGLPGLDGFEVARLLRRDEGPRRALVVALSGYGQEQDRRHSLEAGCDLHWTKPADPEALRLLLESRREVGPGCPEAAAERAAARLRGAPYLALRNVTCECRGGVLTLRGRLPSHHLKQLALATVARVEGVERVLNEIEVTPASPPAEPAALP
jgi:CheY-like chemotaxis protein